MGRRRAEWTLLAPLGELPDRRALEEVGRSIERRERLHRERTLPKRTSQSYADLLQEVLEKVRGTEGVLAFQVDGGGADWRAAQQKSRSSVLAAVGVHGDRSIYVVRYERPRLELSGEVPDLTHKLRAGLPENPEARKELEVLEGRLLRRYPELREALKKVKQPRWPPVFVEAVERGCLLFLKGPSEGPSGGYSQVLVGTDLFELPSWTPFTEETIEEGNDEALLKYLLDYELHLKLTLSPEVLAALIRRRGGPKEAARILAMAGLRVL
jgi:hypothetical protein